MRSIRYLCLALVVSACSSDFDPPYRLLSLRVLAMQSEPVAPAAGETSSLSALVYTLPGVDVDRYAWSWCPFPGPASEGYPCLVDEAQLDELGPAADSIPPFDLGSGDTASFPHTIDPELLTALCTGVDDQPAAVDCATGFPVQLKLTVTAGDEEITAVRELRLRFADEHEANANPTIDGMVAVVGDDEEELGDAPGPRLPRLEESTVRIDVPLEASETFTGEDERGEPQTERERLIVSWFVETGTIDDEQTAFIDGLVDLDAALTNTWEPEDVGGYPRDQADMVVVVRDNRNGVTWRRGAAALEDEP